MPIFLAVIKDAIINFYSQMSLQHILVVDDDLRIRSLLQRYLHGQGFRVSVSANPKEAEEVINTQPLSLMVLDDMMPYKSGRDFLRELRGSNNDMPILMLTARGETADRIAGLSIGADDFLVKPFEPEELVLKIRALLRRTAKSGNELAVGKINLSGKSYDISSQILYDTDNTIIPLTSAEKTLMDILVQAKGRPVNRHHLQTALGINDTSLTRTIDVHLNRLRQKIEINPKNPIHLQTVRHQGYRLAL